MICLRCGRDGKDHSEEVCIIHLLSDRKYLRAQLSNAQKRIAKLEALLSQFEEVLLEFNHDYQWALKSISHLLQGKASNERP